LVISLTSGILEHIALAWFTAFRRRRNTTSHSIYVAELRCFNLLRTSNSTFLTFPWHIPCSKSLLPKAAQPPERQRRAEGRGERGDGSKHPRRGDNQRV